MTSKVPSKARYEADLGNGVALYDVVDLLPKARNQQYRRRDPRVICEQYVHHSGRLGRDGLRGARNSAKYVVHQRGWPGMPYHTWIPFNPVLDEAENLVVFRTQHDETRTYHAGSGPNDRAVAHCLQGNTSKTPPSDFQIHCLYALLRWYQERDVLAVFGHCEAGTDGNAKASCPGSHAMTLLKGFRA